MPPLPSPPSRETGPLIASSKPRVAALDITKGVLVVCMVVYHSLNYSADYTLGFKFLAFLPPSFILISGFLISNVYLRRPDAGTWAVHRRLLVRGTKLLGLFTLLNLLGHAVRGQSHYGPASGVGEFFRRADEIYLAGNGRLAAFEVLVPIAYLILLSPLLMAVERRSRWITPALTGGALAGLVWWEQKGGVWANAHFLTAGLIGFLLGRIPLARLVILGRFWWGSALLYLGYYLLGETLGQTSLIQLLGATVALMLIYGLALQLDEEFWMARRLELLGQYSLLAYIVQIGILQVMGRLAGRPEPVSWQFLGLFAVALVLTALFAELTAWLRQRVQLVDASYRAVFA